MCAGGERSAGRSLGLYSLRERGALRSVCAAGSLTVKTTSYGECVSGDCVSGDCVIGDCVRGDCVSGDCVSGDCVIGDCLRGDCVSGEHAVSRGGAGAPMLPHPPLRGAPEGLRWWKKAK